jgi:hypothetical protein
MTGKWPQNIDHINCNKSDNRWRNLRECEHWQNHANVGPRRTNTSGFKGVSRTAAGRWQACIWVKQKKIALGTYRTPEEAFEAYKRAAEHHFGGFSRTS